MKKVILFLLVISTGTGKLFAQSEDKIINEQTREYLKMNRTEKMFRLPPWYERKRFTFYLRNNNRIVFYFQNTDQAFYVPDIDSLLKQVWTALKPFSEGFSKPLVSRHIDYNLDSPHHRMRILEYPQVGQAYLLQPNDTIQLKVEQDTLNIRLVCPCGGLRSFRRLPYYINLYLNNITDLPSISQEDLEWISETLQSEVTTLLAKSKWAKYDPVSMTFNVAYKTKTESASYPGKKKREFLPYAQGSFQYVRGGWAPSVGLGAEFKWHQFNLQTSYFRILWEPYFFFERTTDKKTELSRTDFISLVYGERHVEEAGSRNLKYAVHFSAGYAIRNKGSWFEDNTFKFSFPGLEYRNIYLYPEFNAHHFFKDVSPSLKLVVNME